MPETLLNLVCGLNRVMKAHLLTSIFLVLRHQALMQAIAVQKGESVVELQPIQREDLKEELLSGAEDLGEEDDAEVVVDVRGADEASGGVIASHTVEFNMIKQFLQNEGGLADVPPFKKYVCWGDCSVAVTHIQH